MSTTICPSVCLCTCPPACYLLEGSHENTGGSRAEKERKHNQAEDSFRPSLDFENEDQTCTRQAKMYFDCTLEERLHLVEEKSSFHTLAKCAHLSCTINPRFCVPLSVSLPGSLAEKTIKSGLRGEEENTRPSFNASAAGHGTQ
mmetsp:Transcript_9918/g.19234  ORF Transcript_9918/g.19234 Transcript_9918/m.19234 type:complete len:144 (-) Transcript_9918:484-915(-)